MGGGRLGHGGSSLLLRPRLLEVDDLVGGGVGVQGEDGLGGVDVVVAPGPHVTLGPETSAVGLAELRSRVGVNWTGVQRVSRTGWRP